MRLSGLDGLLMRCMREVLTKRGVVARMRVPGVLRQRGRPVGTLAVRTVGVLACLLVAGDRAAVVGPMALAMPKAARCASDGQGDGDAQQQEDAQQANHDAGE